MGWESHGSGRTTITRSATGAAWCPSTSAPAGYLKSWLHSRGRTKRRADANNGSSGGRFSVLRLPTLGSSLAYGEACPIERLLIDQVAVCYLRLNMTEQRYENVTRESHTPTLAACWERKLSSTQRRYLRAVETLVRVRKLLGQPGDHPKRKCDGVQPHVSVLLTPFCFEPHSDRSGFRAV